MVLVPLNDRVSIDDDEFVERFVRASGPGGQNVNKVSTAVELRFDVDANDSLPAPVVARLKRLAGKRLNKNGVIVLQAARFRTQELNRADARERMLDLIRQALIAPRPRVRTRPSKASKERRRQSKARRGAVKALRSKPAMD